MKRFLVIMMLGLLSLALVGGCGKKQEEPAAVRTATGKGKAIRRKYLYFSSGS